MRTTIGAILPPVVVAVLAVGAAAGVRSQGDGIVIPPTHADRPGTGTTNVPFGRQTVVRLQAGYDAMNFQAPLVTIVGLALRADEGFTGLGKRVDVEIRASTMAGGIVGLQSSFAANRGADETLAAGRRTVDLPPVAGSQIPRPFVVHLPFDQTFAYAPAGGTLLLEFVVHGQQPGGYPLDATWLCDSVRTSYGPAGCGPTDGGGPVLKADSLTTRAAWGRSLRLRVFDAPPAAATGLFFGSIETGSWNGLAIPHDLSAIGAPGCSLSIDPLVHVGQAADATGTALYRMFVPSQPELRGTFVRFQGVALDARANALGVTTSRPYKIEICGFEAVGRVFTADLGAATGLRELGAAPVVRIGL